MRKEVDFVATYGRDAESHSKFKITEMSAIDAFDWGTKALLAMAKSGVEIPSDIISQGMAGVAVVIVRTVGGLEFISVKDLRQQLLDCVQIYVNPDGNAIQTRKLVGQNDIQEPYTIYQLLIAVLELHLGFSIAESLSKLTSQTTLSADNSRNT